MNRAFCTSATSAVLRQFGLIVLQFSLNQLHSMHTAEIVKLGELRNKIVAVRYVFTELAEFLVRIKIT